MTVETHTDASAPTSGTAARRSRRRGRAIVLALAVPVASAALMIPAAFAADLSVEDQQMVANLNTRVLDARLGGNVSGVVLDAWSDTAVWDHNGATALMPASNTKLGTATAALTVLGPDHRFTTKAVLVNNDTLTLVGGGDRSLTTADLTAMAQTAAESLKIAGLTSVKIAVDDSLFPEPTLANGWNTGYYPNEIAPVRALVVDQHAVQDTSLDAGQVFAKQLAAAGMTVDGSVTRITANPDDVVVADHESAPLSDLVHHMIKVSDNNYAETLLRMTALAAGRPATFDGGTAVVREVLSQTYGVSLDNYEIYDGSGLSRANRIPAAALAEILELLTEPRYVDTLGSILDGLPVSGEAGSTLGPEWGRFDDVYSSCAVGKIHAKTGTLTGAIALSGLTVGKDGRFKVFSFVENGSTANANSIKDAMDGLAATVNGCYA
ncbi:D-alanyl-D-alanine carboxypeptidase/D-alanyl-D-alanine-endopeptidase [Streptomyces sp. NPDC047072]|uniref:D-alanyl-D-alanine carboxypeptidase/D-alanyl-D-alanine endopeptidase n=1 Tax=Streptomyces sp. NPDC047072 TaxID=3154809 RepID=UPI0033DD7415